jgi:maltoporin
MKKIFFYIFGLLLNFVCQAQIQLGDAFSISSYGRLGISTSLKNEQFGARLNLLNQGSIGGRNEEVDYIEISPQAKLNKILKLDSNKPVMSFVMRWQFYSGSNTLIMSNTQSNIVEAYIQVDSLFRKKNKNYSLWFGQRYYRSFYSNVSDYFFYNNSTAQGLGVTLHRLSLALLTTVKQYSSYNPYGDIVTPDFQRILLNIQYKQNINEKLYLHYLGELHSHVIESTDSSFSQSKKPDIGIVGGVLIHKDFNNRNYNELSIRYGYGIANGPGDDNWSSRTYVTYGNPNKDLLYKNAFAVSIVEQYLLNSNKKWNLEFYCIYRYGQGASNPIFIKDYTRENKKQDFSIGARHTLFINDYIHLLTEAHWQTRQYFTSVDSIGNYQEIGWGQMTKFSIIPTFVPSGIRDQNARPHIRLVYSIAFYNDKASQYNLSEYLKNNPGEKIGMYLGIKTEWNF